MELRSRPGLVLRGACAFGLAVWILALFVLTRFPRVEAGTWFSALFMASLFALLTAAQNASEIRADEGGLHASSFLRTLRCSWAGVGRPRRVRWIPGLDVWLLPTHAGTLVFSTLWKGHRELLDRIGERARQEPGSRF